MVGTVAIINKTSKLSVLQTSAAVSGLQIKPVIILREARRSNTVYFRFPSNQKFCCIFNLKGAAHTHTYTK